LSVAVATSGCGRKAGDSAKNLVTPPAHAAGNPRGTGITGAWRWSHLSDEKGVRRVELERWVLTRGEGNQVNGHYDREVTFMSLDGVPFRCSQSLRYELATRFVLRGASHGDTLQLKERSYQVTSSPCDTGYRSLSSYQGTLRGNTLELRWKDGSQTLMRAHTNDPPLAPSTTTSPSTSGNWHWQNRRERAAGEEVRVESESWSLSENEAGSVGGSYQRTVTVFAKNGRAYRCNNSTHYQYTDTYKVHGSRTGNRVIITEVAAEPDTSPCVAHQKRHLDAATGTLQGNFLVLEWRGRHRQILHR